MRLLPPAPGFATEPNLRLFISPIHRAERRPSIVRLCVVPDGSLLLAITTAA